MSHRPNRLFNATLGTAAISALFELGLLSAVADQSEVNLKIFCNERRLHLMSITAMTETLVYYDILETEHNGKTIKAGSSFDEFYQNKGYFLWLIRGYGHMLHTLADISQIDKREGDYLHRDGKFIAMAGKEYGTQFVDNYFNEVLSQMPYKFIADIGCGSAERIINLAKSDSDFKGLGIEFNIDAVKLAVKNIKNENLEKQVEIIHSNITYLAPHSNLEDVDLVMSFFMAHDLWPREECLKALINIREIFPKVKRFLLCDTYRADPKIEQDKPIFTLGFEVTHAMMGQYIPTVNEWIDLFKQAGWECETQTQIGIPNSAIFDLRPINNQQLNNK